MNKRGQFYIIAAIIIVVVISSIASVVTYIIVNPEPRVMKDLSNNLKEESGRIIDYGIYSGADLVSLEDNFTRNDLATYILQKTNNANVTFIYGNKTDLQLVQYSMADAGNICLDSSCVNSPIKKIKNSTIRVTGEDSTDVTILNKTFSFKLRDNEMFYFVITKQEKGETYVETNEGK
ncbi:Uncharacterised protein [uncultured archaeon]|nr:Uncharacterised protein [uncultured archaeon]